MISRPALSVGQYRSFPTPPGQRSSSVSTYARLGGTLGTYPRGVGAGGGGVGGWGLGGGYQNAYSVLGSLLWVGGCVVYTK